MKCFCRITIFLVLAAFGAGMAGCSVSGGTTHKMPATLGQELIDLKKARDKGAVSDKEYGELREKLMESAGKKHWSE